MVFGGNRTHIRGIPRNFLRGFKYFFVRQKYKKIWWRVQTPMGTLMTHVFIIYTSKNITSYIELIIIRWHITIKKWLRLHKRKKKSFYIPHIASKNIHNLKPNSIPLSAFKVHRAHNKKSLKASCWKNFHFLFAFLPFFMLEGYTQGNWNFSEKIKTLFLNF